MSTHFVIAGFLFFFFPQVLLWDECDVHVDQFSRSHKYIPLHRITACFHYLYKAKVVQYKDHKSKNKRALWMWSFWEIAATAKWSKTKWNKAPGRSRKVHGEHSENLSHEPLQIQCTASVSLGRAMQHSRVAPGAQPSSAGCAPAFPEPHPKIRLLDGVGAGEDVWQWHTEAPALFSFVQVRACFCDQLLESW